MNVTLAGRYCTFQLDDLHLGVEVDRVQEVLRPQRMTRVPLASHVVRGLINLRGRIVTALDLRRRLGLPDAQGIEPMNVIVRTDDGAVSFLVDEIDDVLDVADRDVEKPPETLPRASRSLIRGACKLEGRLLLILDVETVLNVGRP